MESHLNVASGSEFIPQAITRPNRPSVLCRYFMNNGYCFYGDTCQFAHNVSGSSNGAVAGRSKDHFFSEGESTFSLPLSI